MVLSVTKGEGVNLVINCVKGDLRNTSIRSTSNLAVILETQIDENFNFGMSHLYGERSYITVNFSSMFTHNIFDDMKKLQLLVSEGISRGYVRPLTRVSYPPHEAARALRLLEASGHRGRVLLRLADTTPTAHPRITCSPDKSHLVFCDDEYHGLQLAQRLIERGAKKIVLHLPTAPTSIVLTKQFWEKKNIDVQTSTVALNGISNIHTLLKDCVTKGPIEGIYFVATTEKKSNQEILSALDALSRKLCLSLKYFAIMSIDKEFGNRTCISREQARLPATKIILPKINRLNASDESEMAVSWSSALDALENAVRSPITVVQAHLRCDEKLGLLQKIAATADIKIKGDVEDTTILRDIGVGQEKAMNVAALIKDEYHMCFSADDIPLLSIKQIQEIDQNSGTILKEVKGLDIFFTHVDTDELSATTEMVFMPTLLCATMRDDEIDMNATTLCIVPGLEGHCERFRELCERLKLAALVLQPSLDFLDESIQETAKRYAEILLKRINYNVNKKFYLVGYESGVLVALELATILEGLGYDGIVYCIGDAPEQFKMLLEAEFQGFDEDGLIRHMFGLMGGKCGVAFSEGSSWEEKVDVCVRALLGRVPQSAQYVRSQFNAALARLIQATQYTPCLKPLRSRLILIRPNSFKSLNPEPLQKYSHQPITVHNLSSSLAHALKDLRCATIINQHLDPEIREEFEKKNLCETYLLNADSYMTMEDFDDEGK